MSRIKRLLESFSSFISVPWRNSISATERVIFCVYNKEDELILRANVGEFEIATMKAGHDWKLFDLTDTFAEWLVSDRYAHTYFKKPELIEPYPAYLNYLKNKFETFVKESSAGENSIIALTGAGSLFGFLKVRELVDQVAKYVPGRLVVFFPGSYDNNNYRLFDAYDGWNYHAIPITESKRF